MVSAASAVGIGRFAFAEHVFHLTDAIATSPYLQTCSERWSEGAPISIERYLAESWSAARRHPEVEVAVGVEFDYVPGDEALRAHTRALGEAHPWDVLLGSVHALRDDQSIFEGESPLTAEEAWSDYHDRLMRLAQSGLVDVVTHPVRLAVSGIPAPLDHGDRLDELAETAARRGVALEVNGSDLRRAPELVTELIGAAARRGAPISLGSDAHRPRTVGSVLPALELLRAAGITETLSFTRRIAKAEDPFA